MREQRGTREALAALEECAGHMAVLFLADLEVGTHPVEFLKEYRKLIERAGQYLPALWESCYRNRTGTLLDQYTLRVIETYRESGIEWESREGNEPQDYFGIECLHLTFLLFLLEETREQALEGNILHFLEQHLEWFAEQLREELGKRYPYFAGEIQRLLEKIWEGKKALKEPAKRGTSWCISRQQLPEALCRFYSKHPELRGLGVSAIPAKETVRVKKRGGGCWNNCGSSCLREVTAVDGCILKAESARTEEPQEERLTTCIRGMHGAHTFLTADRLRYPLLRVGKRGSGEFRRISWEEAIAWIQKENRRIKETYGPWSRYVAYSTGVVSEVRPDAVIRRFLSLDGGYLDFYNDYSAACISYITELMYGTRKTGNSIEDVVNANLILVWGHNPLETGFGPMMRKMLVKAKKKGIRIVVIDPRCSDTAAYAGEWVPIRPGTDGAMAAAMAYVILSEKRQNTEFLHRYCMGFDRETMPEAYREQETFEDYILGVRDGTPKTPDWAEQITGVPAAKTIELARAYAEAKPAAILQGCGPQRQENGEQTARMIAALSCLCGYIGISGGRCGAEDAVVQYPHAAFPRGENPYPGRIPCYLWTKAVCEGIRMRPVEDGLLGVDQLQSNIKMIWCLAGDTLLNQHGDINATKQILEDESMCECIICSDLFMTPGAMYADLVLPGASCFETENLTRAWQEGDFLLYNQKYVEPLFESRYEYDWIRDLAVHEGLEEAFSEGHETAEAWCRTLYEELRNREASSGEKPFAEMLSYEELRQQGIARYPKRDPVIAFREQIEDPKQHPFPTYSGKIELFSPYIYHLYEEKTIAPIPKYHPWRKASEVSEAGTDRFPLVGWHTKVRTHSCHDNNRVLQSKEPQAVWMHPEDAKRLGVGEGGRIRLENRYGKTEAAVKLTERITSGVLAMSQGAWYCPDEEGVDRKGSINVLTTLQPTPLAKGNPQHTIWAEVKKAENPEPRNPE